MSEAVRFHEPLIQKITYLRNQVYENRTVNMGLVKAISKSQMCWYPDNEGKPSLVFHGVEIAWAFETVDDRDGEFARIMQKFG